MASRLDRLSTLVRLHLGLPTVPKLQMRPATYSPGDGRDPLEQAAMRSRLYQAQGTRRNDPCPCGSGKKFKRCCLLTN
jgi:hypothetical protein